MSTHEATQKTVRAALHKVEALRAEATELERATVLLALTECRGIAAHAADLLGIERKAIETMLRYRYGDLGERARALRTDAGYSRGNPALIPGLRPEGDKVG